MRMQRRLAMFAFVALLACGRSEPAKSTGGPMRVVSLSPSATETVAALGATASLVGVDEYSTFPPEVTKLPKVGSFLTPNLEAIVALKPTFVIIDDVHGQAAGALRDAGIETVPCAMHALPDVKTALTTVAARLGTPDAATRAITEMDQAIAAAKASHPSTKPRVLAIIDREAGGIGNLVAGGPGSWIDELLVLVGAENVLAASGIRYPKISLEEIMRTQPDVILDLSFPGRAEIASWQAVDVPATRNHKVVAIAEAFLVAPSPRVKQALAALTEAVKGVGPR
jgi:iron complex transport system substrate-binding protein